MTKNFRNLISVFVLLLAFTACNNSEKEAGFTLNGNIKGLGDGVLLLKKDYNDQNPVKYEIKDGKFTVTGDKVSEPRDLFFAIKDKDLRFGIYVDNGINTFEAEIGKHPQMPSMHVLNNIKIQASIVNDHEKLYYEGNKKIRAKYDDIIRKAEDPNALIEKRAQELNEAKVNFIKAYADAYYSAKLARELAHGENAEGVRKVITLLDPKMDNSQVRALKAKLKDMELTDVDPSEIIKAKNVAYKVSDKFSGKAHTNVKYLGMMSNDNVCALTDGGEIQIIDTKGKELKKFKPELPSKPTTIAVDKQDNIYVMYPLSKKVTRKFRGRTMEVDDVYGFETSIFNAKGEFQNKLQLKGVTSATGARIADGKLLVADMNNKSIGVFDLKTGEQKAELEDMRPCCMILDFAVNAKNEVLVANLGAFRVQAFDLTGKNLLAFGKRGKGVSDFHGCCNPVSVAYLNNGAIVTVEKDPTRVKIFSSEGAKTIAGIDELVKGCSYIPMIVDSKDNLYLASPKKGMIKCVSVS